MAEPLSPIIPAIRYRDAPAAIDFLCTVFGFERRLVVPGPNNAIAHAELVLGRSMIMVSSAAAPGDYGKWVQPPTFPGAPCTQGIYVVIEDVDAHYARTRQSGARILLEPRNEDYGGRDYTCRDPEGHVWTFGSYDPWRSLGA